MWSVAGQVPNALGTKLYPISSGHLYPHSGLTVWLERKTPSLTLDTHTAIHYQKIIFSPQWGEERQCGENAVWQVNLLQLKEDQMDRCET